MSAYYNEIDPDAIAILRRCIADGVIAPGDVDTRSIKEVQADDLRGYSQCHFFAGGGLWSVAARMAGWPDGRPLWTGSCPCQPFSAAGKGAGVDDPRHLWPDFHRLIRAGRPTVVMGEQVAGAAGYGWLDGVRADLASENYTSRGVDIPACSVDAPHQRNRLYWVAVAYAENGGHGEASQGSSDRFANPDDGRLAVERATRIGRGEGRPEHELWGRRAAAAGADASGNMGDGFGVGRQVPASGRQPAIARPFGAGDQNCGCGTLCQDVGPGCRYRRAGSVGNGRGAPPRRDAGAIPSPQGSGEGERGELRNFADGLRSPNGRDGSLEHLTGDGRPQGEFGPATARHGDFSSATDSRNGSSWADAEWIICHDGKARRAKPGLRLLVDGLPGRVGLWRVGGNAIVPVLAAEVIGAFLDAEDDMRAAA